MQCLHGCLRWMFGLHTFPWLYQSTRNHILINTYLNISIPGNILNIYVFISVMFLLLRHSENAIYIGIVNAVITPLGALWWSLFTTYPAFGWQPSFSSPTYYVLAGLIIIVPSVSFYNWFSIQDEKQEAHEQRRIKNQSDYNYHTLRQAQYPVQ